jgi:2,4-dienoyl-CoA reductase-like NADH-dependent reductase (Old Yellow Enzyme family)
MASQQVLSQPFTLSNGSIVRNRLVKAAMSEALGTFDNRPTSRLQNLYARWANGGIGLNITGNVMVDRRALGEPNNIVLEDEADLELLKLWAAAGTQNGTHLWMQLNHPGKQAPRGLNRETVAPSAVPFGSELARFFAIPRELKEKEIEEIIESFGRSAAIAKKAGFSGVQIHGAHGYLVSQFLSPHHNRRMDQWGGSPENRRRFVLQLLREIRQQVGDSFPIGIKLNSADFQRGGFTEEESLDAIRALAGAGIELIEISGGTYEAPVMMGSKQPKESTLKREAYFLEFAEKARAAVQVPLMLTGGFRTAEAMSNAIQSGAIEFVGLARQLAIEPEFPLNLLDGKKLEHEVRKIETGIKTIDRMGFMELAWYTRQLHRMGEGKDPKPNEPAFQAFLSNLLKIGWRGLTTRLRS